MLLCLSALFCNLALAISDYYIFAEGPQWTTQVTVTSNHYLFYRTSKSVHSIHLSQTLRHCTSWMLCPRIWWRWCFGRRILENLRSGSACMNHVLGGGTRRPALRVIVEVLPRYAIVDSLARFFGSSYSFFRSPIWTLWKGYVNSKELVKTTKCRSSRERLWLFVVLVKGARWCERRQESWETTQMCQSFQLLEDSLCSCSTVVLSGQDKWYQVFLRCDSKTECLSKIQSDIQLWGHFGPKFPPCSWARLRLLPLFVQTPSTTGRQLFQELQRSISCSLVISGCGSNVFDRGMIHTRDGLCKWVESSCCGQHGGVVSWCGHLLS